MCGRPTGRTLQITVVLSLALMLAAKLVTVAMPFTFKWATDALVAAAGGKLPDAATLTWLIGAPVLAILIYGATRIAMSLLVQVREGMFAKVAMHAVRKLALTHVRAHAPSCRCVFIWSARPAASRASWSAAGSGSRTSRAWC